MQVRGLFLFCKKRVGKRKKIAMGLNNQLSITLVCNNTIFKKQSDQAPPYVNLPDLDLTLSGDCVNIAALAKLA